MPMTVHEVHDGWGNIIVAEGHVTSEEYDKVLTEHLSKPEEVLKKYYYSIVDATKVTDISVQLKYVKKISNHSLEVAKINPHVIVVIATHNELAFNIVRLWGYFTSASNWNIQVFRTKEELDKWLVMKMKDVHDISDIVLNPQ